MAHLTFGNTLNISDVINKKNRLNKVKHTVFTRSDGSRYAQDNDEGTITELPRDSSDENGSWAIMDESAALGLSKESDELKDEKVGGATNGSKSADENTKAIAEIIKKHPQLAQYLMLIKIGVPVTAIRSKIFAEGVADSLPEGVAQTFCEAIGASVDFKEEAVNASELVGTPMKGSDHSEMHGHLGNKSWPAPLLASYCETPARAGYNTEKGHEYLDSPAVLKEKVKLLASLLKKAAKPVIYAGAGLSTASGIGDYATQTGQSGVLASSGHRGANISPFCVKPNYGHHTIAALAKKGLVHRFVQQNHDGLPQKAGMSQGLINEIHGGWFDPSNPVVAMTGGLRSDLFEDLLTCEKEADLVIAVGSSLCGMNADRLVSSAANRAKQYRQRQAVLAASSKNAVTKLFSRSKVDDSKQPCQFGSVIISLQKTVHDHNSSLRIFALIDDVFKLLAEELELDMSNIIKDTKAAATIIEEGETAAAESEETIDMFKIPYDKEGKLLKTAVLSSKQQPMSNNIKQAEEWMMLDLREGAELVITSGPDQGAQAVVLGKNKDGHYRISVQRRFKNKSTTFNETRLLGSWWPHNAMNAEVDYVPVVNR